MPITADQAQAQTATSVDLGAIFVSLELSKATCIATALSPVSERCLAILSLEATPPDYSRVLPHFARKPNGETLIRALMAWKRGEPRACSMVKLLTPDGI